MPLAVLKSHPKLEYAALLLQLPVVLRALVLIVKTQSVHIGKRQTFWLLLILLLVWNTLSMIATTPRKLFGYAVDVYQIVEMLIVLWYSIGRRGEEGLRPLLTVSVLYILLNFLSLVMYRRGMFMSSVGSIIERCQWLFGSKNNMPIYLTTFSFLILAQEQKKLSSRLAGLGLILIAGWSVASAGSTGRALFQGSSTGIVTSVIAIAAAVLMLRPGRRSRFFEVLTVKRVMVITLFLNLVFLGGVSLPFVNRIIVDVFGKSPTFSNRTFIWENALHYISRAPLFGYGAKSIVLFRNGATSTYNVFLGLMKSYGVPSALLLLLTGFSIPNSSRKSVQVLLVGLFAVFINGLMSQVELKFVVFFMAVICMLSNLRDDAKPQSVQQ